MWRRIKSGTSADPTPIRKLKRIPKVLTFSLDSRINRTNLVPLLEDESHVEAGTPIAESEDVVLHTPLSGVLKNGAESLTITCNNKHQARTENSFIKPTKENIATYAREIGLVGMGGSMFPTSIKLEASSETHTIVINCVECEPGIEIDEAILTYHLNEVEVGIKIIRESLPIKRVVLAIKSSSASHIREIATKNSWELLIMNNLYPAGAEKLIVGKLTGKIPRANKLPFHLGYLVMNTASIWALGNSIVNEQPVTSRPLTVVLPNSPQEKGTPQNLFVPLGTSVKDVILDVGFNFNSETDIAVAGGPMMGKEVSLDDSILKGTNAITIIRKTDRITRKESPCTLCSSCFDVCPLGLHPIEMAKRVKKREFSTALDNQLTECFLCGACSAVCPSDIPLVQHFEEGKQWLKTKK
jgi:electron transport complex protein RnfC